ncbi:MAG: hypothetical protein IJQ31_04680 [Thermoguttaceae bacterium]|nr:hypothetical protein [Thermoguttaceae bacterium]
MRKQMKKFFLAALGIAALFLVISQSMAEMPYTTTKSQDCGQNIGAPKGRVGLHRVADPEGGWQTKGFVIDSFGPMPQTAYDPNYGCYPGNARTIHRYPAFHGYYYDRPYNYRHYSEYPWNAEITEPRPYPNRANQVGSEVIIQSVPTPVESITPAETTSPAQSIMGPVTTPVEEVEPSSNMIPEQIDEVIEESIPTTKSSDPLLEDLL